MRPKMDSLGEAALQPLRTWKSALRIADLGTRGSLDKLQTKNRQDPTPVLDSIYFQGSGCSDRRKGQAVRDGRVR